MGKILGYLILISNLSLILGQQYKAPPHGSNYEREKQQNFSQNFRHYYPKDQNGFLNKKMLPNDFRGRLQSTNPKDMRRMVGLHAFAAGENDRKNHHRNFSQPIFRSPNPPRRNVPPFPHNPHQRKNSKNIAPVNYHAEVPQQKFPKPDNSFNYQNKRPDDNNRRFHNGGRHPKFHGQHSQHSAKICDPCNSVPWTPIFNVPDSYRQQRTHLTEFQDNYNFDYHGFSSDTHNVLLPPVSMVPSLEPIYDGTISSSFGLPIGNIPTGHGLLAPINHMAPKFNHYEDHGIDYSSSFNFYSPPGLLETHAFPELSAMPMVPIHDSGQFLQFDSSIPDLVPPPTKPVDVSNVVLTINEEEESTKLKPPKPDKYHNHKTNGDLSSASSAVNSHPQNSGKTDNKNFQIVQSIPLAEFTSSVEIQKQRAPLQPPLPTSFPDAYTSAVEIQKQRVPLQHPVPTSFPDSFTSSVEVQKQRVPLQQPLPTSFPDDFVETKKDNHVKKSVANSLGNYGLLTPPKTETDISFRTNITNIPSYPHEPPKSELQGESSAPKPLTSPSLSWLFADHTAPPSDSKNTASVLSFATDTQEIASVVNNELRPVSPLPIPISAPGDQNAGNTKSKKIQIIIPYTTKNKNEHDINALESIQHEVFQPPVSKSTSENISMRDSATPSLPHLSHEFDTTQDRKPIDGAENKSKEENENRKYLTEMQHVIATNLRELLRDEMEKSQTDQNYPLQNNIDNWTALEYSNHKTVGTKAPKEIITQALAVTSIPGTSISHLLLPSKKIPNEYFKTTPIPVYDEPSTSVYKTTNSTVNSSPFTAKPYASTNVYNPTRALRENIKQKENTPPVQVNHEKNYTEVGRGRVNNWGRLNENLVLPEARSRTRRIEDITTPSWNARYISSGGEKVQIVTPISLTTRNYTTSAFRRTTRHIHKLDNPTTVSPNRNQFFNRLNSTKLEKVSNETSPFNRKFTYNSTTTQNVSSVVSAPTDDKVLVVESVKSNSTGYPKDQTVSDVKFDSKNEHLSINDIFPFRNKELPWESNRTIVRKVSQIGRTRKSLIKQVNLPRTKNLARSS